MPVSHVSRASVAGLLLVLSPVVSAHAQTPSPPVLKAETCSLDGLMDSIRRGLGSKSEAYRGYLRALLRETAVTLPEAQLRDAFARERDPAMVEHLAAALVARTDRGLESSALDAVRERALGDADPAVRAATVRAMRRSSAIERTGDMYERLMRDASPDVRREAATNLIEDNQFVYSGHHGPAADAAVAAAVGSTDASLTARILGTVSTEAISADSQARLQRMLRGGDSSVRAAAVTALGGVPASGMKSSRESLLAMYREEEDPEVRKAILQSIARLGFSGAVPDLQRLREVDPRLAPEVDAWTRVLGMGLQEWSLLLREKQRLSQAR
ncbi:HEAT repeat domain-containing protein [Corallococcus sp. M34]|uniref:HEAT repeat domain-containing protein n=1 Tax=Citreicoccus inhibens TaxID=2849499 RepID=UPI001C218E23|nr:HEAT repeat domain-containing protein [Citreicoccus inhibens]MBU8896059.1 HEAT repeat domain-containing protein [Citreicoccus inhibens]